VSTAKRLFSISKPARAGITACVLMTLTVLTTGCSQRPGIVHKINPEPAGHVEIVKDHCARIRTRMADVTVEPVNNSTWKILLKQNRFITKDASSEYRYPGLHFFKLIITNNTGKPVTLKGIQVNTAGKTFNSLQTSEVMKQCDSKAYSIFNFQSLLSPYRLLTDKICLKNIDTSHDILYTKIDFIPPGDTIMQIVAFQWIPVQYRNFTLSIDIRRDDEKKVVDFKMKRIEYRTRGSHFREKPGEKMK
jgi:hypothetical protein